MIDIVFVVTYLFIPVAVIFLLKLSRISLLTISIPSVFVLFYLSFAYAGILPLYFQWDKYRAAVGVVDKEIILRIFFYSSTSILLIVAGFVYANRIMNISTVPHQGVLSPLTKGANIAVIFVFIVCVAVLLIYLHQLPGIPILAALSGDLANAKLLRSLSGNDFAGHYWRYYLFFGKVLPFVTFVLFAQALFRRSLISYLLFIIAFCFSLFAAVMSTAKVPAILLIIGLGIVYVLVKHQGKIPIKLGIIAIAFVAGLASVMYIYFMGAADILSGMKAFLSRVFTGQIHPAYYYLEMFPAHHDYLMGKSFPNPAGIFPFENFRLTVEVMNYAFPELAGKGIVGSAPTMFWAEMYANFGPIGPFITSFAVGVAIYIMHMLISRLPDSPVKAGLIAWVALHLACLYGTSLSNYLFDVYLYATLIISLTLFFISGKGVIRVKRMRRKNVANKI